jgi:Flp pilus assembly protein TadG
VKTKRGLFSLLAKLGKNKRATGPRLLARLIRDEEGSYLLYMTITIPIFIGLAGLATEGALIFYNHRNVQSAADSAAYSAAISYSLDSSLSNATTQAKSIVAKYGFTVGTDTGQANVVVGPPDTTTYSDTTKTPPIINTAINVTVTRPQLPILSSIWVTGFNVRGSAWAIISGGSLPGGGSGGCILSLATSGTGISLGGTTSISDPDGTCGVFSNSTGSTSIKLIGTASITAGSVGAAGSVSVGGSANIGPPPDGYTQNDNQLINPYTGVTTSAPSTATGSGCTYTDTVINSGGTVPLPTGTYCTSKSNKPAIDVLAGSTATLSPGTYIVNGAFDVKGATVTCPTCSTTNTSTFTLNSDFNISLGSTVTLGAGTYTFNGNVTITGPNSGSNTNVTLGAGTYIFVGPGQFSVDAHSTLTGKGVTLEFTDPGGVAYPSGANPTAMSISSGADILLEAPTSGATLGVPGMMIIGNNNIPLDTKFNLQANGTGSCTNASTSNCIGGVIYLPTADFTWQGGPVLTGGCTQMIAYRLIMNGNAVFNNSNCQLGGGGGGGASRPPIGNRVTLVK